MIEPDEAVFARNDAEIRDLWRKRVKYDLLGLKAEKAKAKAADDKKADDKKAADKKAADKTTEGKAAAGGDDGPRSASPMKLRVPPRPPPINRPPTTRLRRKNCRAAIARSSSAGVRLTTASCWRCI